MKILLISPTIDLNNRNISEMVSPALGLYILEGITPKEHEVKIIEEERCELDLEEDCDLVGISCMTCTAPRGYNLATEFKKRGKTVIMGGIHPTVMPDEALQYVDSVIIGEAEEIWNQVLDDFQSGKLRQKYFGKEADLNKFVPLNYERIKTGFFKQLNLITTRGCPYSCEFCSIPKAESRRVRHVPIEYIIKYITESKSKRVVFHDDNLVGDPVYAKELFKALIPLKIKWLSQSSLSMANDDELLQLAKDSGCQILLVGLESISKSQIENLPKQTGNIKKLEDVLKKIRKAGILIHAFVIFGFDTDTKDIFKNTVRFLIKNKICSTSFCILTPYPNIKFYQELKNASRIIFSDWKYYTHSLAVFKPKNMTAYELQLGKINAGDEFYKLLSVAKRLSGNLFNPFLFLAANFIWRQEIKQRKKWYNETLNRLRNQ